MPTPGWIDRHLDDEARLRGVDPAGEADPLTLCRRIHLVLTGLPPTVEQIAWFLGQPPRDRVERTVDGLLASAAHAEHWARHWLDVVRYADSVTLRGLVFREAWRYRDYVVGAFRDDLPFERFVQEQVAGDLLPAGGVAEAARLRVAPTFWALGDANLEEQDKRQLDLDVLDEQLEVLGKAFLGQTLACARCHDHKFDPVPARDYHAMAGILAGTRLLRHANVSEWIETPLPLEPDEEARVRKAEEGLRALEEQLRQARARKAVPEGLEAEVAAARITANRPRVMAPVEVGATNLPFLRRGDWRQAGPPIPRGFLQTAFSASTRPPSGPGSGRLELAAWLTAADQPLTRRVQVNRVWHWVFGQGVVPSVDNLGTTGEPPSHPALLDALAAGFREGGGSTRALIRTLVLTRAFARSSDPRDPRVAQTLEADPLNRWLGRFQSRPVEAEALRDSMLRVAGILLADGPGSPPFPRGLSADYGQALERPVRTLYLPQFRNARPDFLVAFDGADPGRVTGARESSQVAPQALLLLNHPFVRSCSVPCAEAVVAETDPIEALWRRILGRPPTAAERRAATGHLAGGPDLSARLAELAHGLLASLDFRRIP
ncbi:MAG: DUF1549 and DUF1553 domain-containing protein [Verrucomicrobiota bacterium]